MNEHMHVGPLTLRLLANLEGPPPKDKQKIVNGQLLFFPYQGEKDQDGIITAGYGHVIRPGEMARFQKGITPDEALVQLKHDVAVEYEAHVKRRIHTELNQAQFDGLTLLDYNAGEGSLCGEIGAAVNAREFYLAVKLIATLYVKTRKRPTDPKLVTDGLVRRRLTEAWLFHTGEIYHVNTPQKRDYMLRNLMQRRLIPGPGVLPAKDEIWPDYHLHPQTGYPA